MNRLDRFKELMAAYQQTPADYDAGEEEDPRPYIDGEKPLSRYVCVTVNYTSHGYGKYFFLPDFDTPEGAASRATEYTHDDIFEELPVSVYDLDTGEEHKANYSRVPFHGLRPKPWISGGGS
jgi:hypothetical protein